MNVTNLPPSPTLEFPVLPLTAASCASETETCGWSPAEPSLEALLARRRQILAEMAQCDTMEYGSLKEERRQLATGGTSASYYKHQVWNHGKNVSQRIPREDAPALAAAIANRQRFEALANEFMDLTVILTRRRCDDTEGHGSTQPVRRWKRPALRSIRLQEAC